MIFGLRFLSHKRKVGRFLMHQGDELVEALFLVVDHGIEFGDALKEFFAFGTQSGDLCLEVEGLLGVSIGGDVADEHGAFTA